jgi:hypothetical protein
MNGLHPFRKLQQRILEETKSAARDDLTALSAAVTGHHADVCIQASPEAAGEQGAALSACERAAAALEAARRAQDMGAVSRAIAEGQYHLACADALAAGQLRPGRRPSCFFDPRHGMSVGNVRWSPDGGITARSVPACSACAHKVGQGVEPDIRKVETHGALISYVDADFAPAYWAGYGFDLVSLNRQVSPRWPNY